jgi:predicted N-acetyltransferase YhbS
VSVGAYEVRSAATPDFPCLRSLDPALPSRDVLAAARAAGLVWVATAPGADEPVGYLAAARLEEGLLVARLAVAVAHRRRGVGATLLAAAVDRARWSFEPAILLVADRDADCGDRFVAKYGFVALSPGRLPPALRAGPGQVAMAKRL